MKAKNPYKEEERVELTDEFRKKLFQKLFEITSTKYLASELHISRSILYHYRNKRVKTIPLSLLEKLIKIVRISIQELENNIVKTISSKDLRHKGLNVGKKFRISQIKQWKNSIPHVEDLIDDGYLNFEKWFKSYLKLINFGVREIKKISKKRNKLTITYTNYVKGKKEKFTINLPVKIPLDENFQYFFGLWCGDKAGGGRLGIVNKQKELIFITKKFLKKIFQKPRIILLKSSRLSKLPKFSIKIDKVWEVKNMAGSWVFCVFCVNGILKSFFDYLYKNLDKFLSILPNKNIFFAGLFDAEGNVSFEDQCFRWSCKDEEKVKIYKKFLQKYNLFQRYDGSNLITNNIAIFSKLILPYLKHKKKLNAAKLICSGKGKLDHRFKSILRIIKDNEGLTIKKIALILKKKKVYSQIRFLEKYKYVYSKSYPKQIYISTKGLKELRGEGR